MNEMQRSLTLSQFCAQIKYVVEQSRLEAWVTAEIAQVSISRGHYYLELIQKADDSDAPAAKLKCNIWAGMAREVLSPFWEATGGDVGNGMKVLVYVRATFHTVYGLSGLICGIDPTYTLGDLEARRRAIWAQLEADGIADMNKSLTLPSVIKNIAVVSAETAAGYGDFCNQLTNNQYGIVFHTTLFPAIVQGNGAEDSVVKALEAIADKADRFDVAVIIRGGGSKMDLACFDSYNIACSIAQFPIPVITGIGHDRDRSIADLVAHTSVKTPTAVAEFIVSVDCDFLLKLEDLKQRVATTSANIISANRLYIERLGVEIKAKASNSLVKRRNELASMHLNVINTAKMSIESAKHQIQNLETQARNAITREISLKRQELGNMRSRILSGAIGKAENEKVKIENAIMRIKMADPRTILNRGYSMTTGKDGKNVKSVNDVKVGDTITTHFADGSVTTQITGKEVNK